MISFEVGKKKTTTKREHSRKNYYNFNDKTAVDDKKRGISEETKEFLNTEKETLNLFSSSQDPEHMQFWHHVTRTTKFQIFFLFFEAFRTQKNRSCLSFCQEKEMSRLYLQHWFDEVVGCTVRCLIMTVDCRRPFTVLLLTLSPAMRMLYYTITRINREENYTKHFKIFTKQDSFSIIWWCQTRFKVKESWEREDYSSTNKPHCLERRDEILRG